MACRTPVDHLQRQARELPDRPAYHRHAGGRWQATSWKEYAGEVRRAARALLALGLEPGDTVSILGFNRPEWTILDLAAMMAGGVPAGIYVTSSQEEIAYIVGHAESRWILVENRDHWQRVVAVREGLPRLERILLMSGAEVPEDPATLSWQAFLDLADQVPEERLDERIAGLRGEDLALLIYTSGTTGPPKAVMLSHDNLVWTASTALAQSFDIGPADCSLSYLPLSHIAERVFTVHGSLLAGYSVYFARGPERVADDLREVQPTLVFGVPRVWERLASAVQQRLAQASPLRRRLFRWAQGVGRAMSERRCREKEPAAGLGYRLAHRLVFSRLKPRLGLGRARVCVSGAAPIAREVLEFFAGLDVLIYEVYGQSEGSGPTSLNRPGLTRLGTVGPALPDVEVRIAEDCEILVRGPNVFLGYAKDPQATAETLDGGWLHSGDLGSLDEEGFLSITGRKKDILITSGGKNVAPANIEAALKELDLVQDAVVLGDRRRYLTALLTLDCERAAALAPGSTDLATDPHVLEAVGEGVERINQRFARVQQVRGFRLLQRPFTIEGGELTPTLKLRRQVIAEKYAAEIEALYRE